MKKTLLILFILAYSALLLIDTAQLVSLYEEIIGEEGTGVSPWLSLFSLNLIVLLSSFRKPDWGKIHPAKTFAVILGILHLWFFHIRIDGASILEPEWIEKFIPGFLFSLFISVSIYFSADAIASISEERGKGLEESRKQIEADRKSLEEREKKFEELFNEREGDIKRRESVLNAREALLNTLERDMKKAGKKLKYGNGYVKIDFVDGKWEVKKVS